jgi:hypothetical protein
MLKAAFSHIFRCPKALLIYVGIIVGYVVLKTLVEEALIPKTDDMDIQSISKVYLVSTTIITSAIFAFAQALAFPMLGREIDKPLWKIQSTPSIIFQFFSFWLTLNFLLLTIDLLISLSGISNDDKFSIYLWWLMSAAFLVPFGSTVMFYGQTGWQEIKQAITTIFGQFPYYMGITFLTFFFYLIFVQLHSLNLPIWGTAGLQTLSTTIDCIVFSFCWEVCKKHRDEQETMDDIDF